MNAQQEKIAKLEKDMEDMEQRMKKWTVTYFDTMKGLEAQNQELKHHVDACLLSLEALHERIDVLEK